MSSPRTRAAALAVQLPGPSPLRRTRSQAAREEAAASGASASPVGAASGARADGGRAAPEDSGAASPMTPVTPGRRRTRASVAAAAAQGVPLSPDVEVAPSSRSPSLRVRASAAVRAVQHQIEETSASFKMQLEDAGNSLKQSCTRYQLVAYEHCPEWLKDNQFIRGGYRANIGWRQSVESACHMHNETVNVWTHLIALLCVGIILVMTMSVLSPHGVDRLDLDVVLSARAPQCSMQEGGMVDPACASPPPVATAAANGARGPAVGGGDTDPLDELHRLLGDSQDEMLVELVSRVQTLLPNLQSLTVALKQRASELQRTVMSAMPEQASRTIESGGASLAAYMNEVELKLAELTRGAAELVTPGPSTQAAGDAVAKKYHKLRDTLRGFLSDFSRHFSPNLLSYTASEQQAGYLDLIPVTRRMLADFMSQARLDKKSLSLKPSVTQVPGIHVQVKVKNPAAELLGGVSGTLAQRHAMNLLGDQSGSNDSSELRETQVTATGDATVDGDAAVAPPTTTTLDADGGGKTVSTAIGYLGVAVHTRASNPGKVELQLHSYLPRFPLAVFLVTAMLCLGFSSTYHLLQAVSDEWARRFQALDYAGIVLLIAGSTSPIIYYGFFCSPWLRVVYMCVVWLLGVIVFTIVVLPMYRSPRYRLLKTACFIALGFSGTVPLMHFQWHLGEVHFITYWLLVMGACYLTGAAIYATQVPERWWPGSFDLVGSSHQLWHVSIFLAVLVHYVGLMHMFEWRMTRVCTPDMFS